MEKEREREREHKSKKDLEEQRCHRSCTLEGLFQQDGEGLCTEFLLLSKSKGEIVNHLNWKNVYFLEQKSA
jgi:hypothetical protein